MTEYFKGVLVSPVNNHVAYGSGYTVQYCSSKKKLEIVIVANQDVPQELPKSEV